MVGILTAECVYALQSTRNSDRETAAVTIKATKAAGDNGQVK